MHPKLNGLPHRLLRVAFSRGFRKRKECERSSRMNHYGEDMPECPAGLTEIQYVGLLAGRGCQIRKCTKTETQKVHWIFQGRLCSHCLAEKTMRVCSAHLSSTRPLLTNTTHRSTRSHSLISTPSQIPSMKQPMVMGVHCGSYCHLHDLMGKMPWAFLVVSSY